MKKSGTKMNNQRPAEMKPAGQTSALPMGTGADRNDREVDPERIALINRLHDEIRESAKSTARKAISLGENLLDLKRQIGHRGWLKYVKEHLPFTDRTAQRYMGLAENKEALLAKFDNVSDFNLSEAYRVMAARRTPAPETSTTEQSDREKPSKGEIITGLTRDLSAELERFTVEQLVEFKEALARFKEDWMKSNALNSEAEEAHE